MRITRFASSILLVSLMLLIPGCKAKDAASNSAAKPAPAASSNASPSDDSNRSAGSQGATRNSNAKESDAPAKAKESASPQLAGTYEAREVEDKGIVTLISKVRTVISFSPEGTYSRISQVSGKTYHSDSGLFRIQPPDKLVLTIQVSKKQIQTPPLLRTHTFSLSPDGDELKLTSEKGTVAIFRRVSKPKTS